MELSDVRLNEIMEGGTVSIPIGEKNVLVLGDPERRELCILAAIGVPPEEGAEAFDRQLLEEDFQLAASGRKFLSFDSESGKYVIGETVSSVGLDDEALRGLVTALDGMRDAWRDKLADIRPANQDGLASDEGFIRG